MKKSIKNVLMVAVIALLSMGMVFTYCYAKKNITANTFASMNGGTSPSMPSNSNEGNGNNSGSDLERPSGSNVMMPPDNNNSNGHSTPAKPRDDDGTVPAKPDGDNTIVNNDTTGNFLRVQKDSWGNSGSNGGDVTLNLKNQKLTGDSYITSLINENSSNSNIDFNGYKLYVNGVAIN